jgi:hypothetical protein
MPAYSPCPACQRHVRQHERACPFCAVALPPSAGCTPGTACQAIPRDAKRATVIALSLGLVASACVDDNATPIYGSPSAPLAGAGGTSAGGTNSGGTSAGGTVGGTSFGNNFSGSSAGGTDNGGTSGTAGEAGGGASRDAGRDADAADADVSDAS